MRSTKFNLSSSNLGAWGNAVKLTEDYLSRSVKANRLLDALSGKISGPQRARCQALFLGGLRHGHRIQTVLKPFIQHKPRALIEAILLVTGYEMLSAAPEKLPLITHHAVETSKQLVTKTETGLLNALLRKLPDALGTVHPHRRPDVYFSHPRWLFKRWNKAFGPQPTLQLMQWNQQIPARYLRFYRTPKTLPRGLEPTQWNHFYKLSAETSWQQDVQPLLNKGIAYIKDPSTRLAPELLAPARGECVLDLCAAPGGKTYDLAHRMELEGSIVALDLPGERIERLRENLRALDAPSLQYTILETDLLAMSADTLRQQQLPTQYDAVMLDAPCSNTGVIQRRTDVKWRLRSNDIETCADLQKQLIAAASHYVKPGGRLVYSTCSIEPDENQAVIDHFLESEKGKRFTFEKSILSLPWSTGHDGAGAFLLVAEPL